MAHYILNRIFFGHLGEGFPYNQHLRTLDIQTPCEYVKSQTSPEAQLLRLPFTPPYIGKILDA